MLDTSGMDELGSSETFRVLETFDDLVSCVVDVFLDDVVTLIAVETDFPSTQLHSSMSCFAVYFWKGEVILGLEPD